jgi:hypothetical protein
MKPRFGPIFSAETAITAISQGFCREEAGVATHQAPAIEASEIRRRFLPQAEWRQDDEIGLLPVSWSRERCLMKPEVVHHRIDTFDVEIRRFHQRSSGIVAEFSEVVICRKV